MWRCVYILREEILKIVNNDSFSLREKIYQLNYLERDVSEEMQNLIDIAKKYYHYCPFCDEYYKKELWKIEDEGVYNHIWEEPDMHRTMTCPKEHNRYLWKSIYDPENTDFKP